MRGTSVVWIVALIVSLGCGTPSGGGSKSGRGSDTTRTVDGLVKTDIDMPGVLFLREDHGIGSYDAFVVPPVAINYKRKGGQLKPALESEVKTIIRDSLVESVQAAQIPIVDKPSQCVMQVGLALYNVNIERGSSASNLGQMTLVMEFRDSLSGQPLLRYATQNKIENKAGNRSRQLRKGFDEMIEDLDLGAAFEAAELGGGEIRPGCNGLMAKLGQDSFRAVSAR